MNFGWWRTIWESTKLRRESFSTVLVTYEKVGCFFCSASSKQSFVLKDLSLFGIRCPLNNKEVVLVLPRKSQTPKMSGKAPDDIKAALTASEIVLWAPRPDHDGPCPSLPKMKAYVRRKIQSKSPASWWVGQSDTYIKELTCVVDRYHSYVIKSFINIVIKGY